MNRLLAIVKNDEEADQRLDVLNRCFGPLGNSFKKGITSDGKYELVLTGVKVGAPGEMVTESDIKQMKDVAAGRWVPANPEEVAAALQKARAEAGDQTRGRVGDDSARREAEAKVTNPEAQRLRDSAHEPEPTVGQLGNATGGTDDSTAPVNTPAPVGA